MGNYPYEYMNGREQILLTELPPIDAFYSSLSEETITPEEYERAQKMWRELNIEKMQQYHDLYLNLVVLLLADAFENFRQTCIMDYGLTPLIITLYRASHSMHVSNLPNRNWTCLPTVKSSFLSRTLFAAELAS